MEGESPNEPERPPVVNNQPMRNGTPARIVAGVITRVTNAGDGKWGKVRHRGSSREVFFTSDDLVEPREFDKLAPGQQVEFQEQPDRAEGMRAVNLRLVDPEGS
jgi:cold shock CspA family protein